MPTGAEGEPPVHDGTGEQATPAVESDGMDSFLSAVRGMVHGGDAAADQAPETPSTEAATPLEKPPSQPGPPAVAEGQPAGWLPGTWVVEEPPVRRGRRRARRVDDPLARHERKLLDAERRSTRKRRKKRDLSAVPADAAQPSDPAGETGAGRRRIPAQPETQTAERSVEQELAVERAGDSTRRKRRERRREAARAQRLSDATDEAEQVDELVESAVIAGPARGSRRGSGRERRRGTQQAVAVDPAPAAAESGETDTVSNSMAETASMSEVDAALDPSASRRSKRRPRTSEPDGALPVGTPEAAAAADGAVEPAAEKTATRTAARRRRLQARVAAQEARAAAKAMKRQRRLDERAARVGAKNAGEAKKLERRHERRADRLQKRAERAEAKAAAEAAVVESRQSRRARRLEKRTARSEAKTLAATEKLDRRRAEIAAATSPPVDDRAGLSPRQRRRERRRDAALERAMDRVAEGLPPSVDPEHEDETLAEYVARVEAPTLPRRSRRTRSRVPVRVRRAASITAVAVLIGGAAVLPWAVPEVRSIIADAVPGGGSTVVPVEDPPVEPPEATPGTAPVEEGNRFEGVRLQSAGTPREVVVPRLHVDSEVVPISGQTGELLPPSDPQILGWWREGQAVGAAEGSAVITGHTVHTGGGALDHLDKLVVGDSLRVRTDDGWIRYVVQRARIYPTEELAREAEAIFRLDGPGRLVVITCDDWNGEFYESNAVVFAAPVADQPFGDDGDVPDAGPEEGQ